MTLELNLMEAIDSLTALLKEKLDQVTSERNAAREQLALCSQKLEDAQTQIKLYYTGRMATLKNKDVIGAKDPDALIDAILNGVENAAFDGESSQFIFEATCNAGHVYSALIRMTPLDGSETTTRR